MIPWIIVGIVAVPVLIFAFAKARGRTDAVEHSATQTEADRAELDREFAAAEAYQEQWREEDKPRHDAEPF